MKTKAKHLLAVLLVIMLVQLSCSEYEFLPDDRTSRQRDRDECEEDGGIWHDTGVLGPWCEWPSEAPAPAEAGTESTNPGLEDPAGPEGSLQECDATPFLAIAVNFAPEENSCVCAYRLAITNNHPAYAVIVFSHVTQRFSPESGGANDLWLSYAPGGIPVGGTVADGGTGVLFEAWGGLYSTCALEDGGYSAAEYMYTDRVFARYALPGCDWIDDPAEYESSAITLSDSCNP